MVCLAAVATPGLAQEVLRMSMTGEQSAEARRHAARLGHYNLRWGNSAWSLSSSLGMGYQDNVDLTPQGTGDFFFQPGMALRVRWQTTERNAIDFSISGGYMKYLEHDRQSRFYVNPDSELSFDINIGNVQLNLHERPRIQQNAYQDPTVSGSGDVLRFENNLGMDANWDMNQVLLRLGYDHVNYITLQQSALTSYPDGQSEIFGLSAAYVPKAGRSFGLEGGLSLLSYDQASGASATNAISGGLQSSAGMFYREQFTDHIRFEAHVGYTSFAPEMAGQSSGAADSGIYFSAAVTHQIHEKINYTLSFSRTVNLAFFGGSYEINSFRLTPTWNVIRKVGLSTPIYYERWSQVDVPGRRGDQFDLFGAGFMLTKALSEKLSSTMSYQFIQKNSQMSNSGYTMNTLTLSFSYRF